MGPVARCVSQKCHETVEIELQLIGASLRSIADEMGAVLIRSAFSANIKERRDCSTALFDRRGRITRTSARASRAASRLTRGGSKRKAS